MDDQNFDFAITHRENPEEAIKHFSVSADSAEKAGKLAEEALDDYREGLQVNPEEFE